MMPFGRSPTRARQGFAGGEAPAVSLGAGGPRSTAGGGCRDEAARGRIAVGADSPALSPKKRPSGNERHQVRGHNDRWGGFSGPEPYKTPRRATGQLGARRPDRLCMPGARELLVPLRYHADMAMNLRLSDAETDALRRKAEEEGRSMQEVARAAITDYVSERPQRLAAAIERVRSEDAELLDRLSR